jgi:hypothetical protein
MTPIASQKAKLLKTVERSFVRAGWQVGRPQDDLLDLRVDCGHLGFLIKCLDQSRISFEGATTILSSLERQTRAVRSARNRQLIVVLDRNFLSIDLESLLERRMFAITTNDIERVTNLATVSGRPPGEVDKGQAYLLETCVEYAAFVSQVHRKNRDFAAAIKWGRCAVEHSIGYTAAYPELFESFRAAGEFEAATELGQEILRFHPDNPHFLRGMEELALKRGDRTEAARWRKRWTDHPTTPRTLGDILAKQRMDSKSDGHFQVGTSASVQRSTKFNLARLFRSLRRCSTR